MPNWIVKPHREEWVEYSLWFELVDHPGSGFAYDCDEHGNVDRSKLSATGLRNLDECLGGSVDGRALVSHGVCPRPRSWYNSGSIRCRCGAEHHLVRGDSMCESCGQHYNAVGQELVDPEHWED